MSADRCLVTGASGFIGGHVAQRLAGDGLDVRCLVRAGSDTTRLRGLELAHGDLADPPSVARAASGARWVVHCAALVSDWALPAEIARVNVGGTRAVLDAAAAAGAQRVVHVSTTDVYGHPGTPATDETHVAAGFANWYAESKRRAEDEVRRVGAAAGLEAVVVRPSTVYGPRSADVVGEIARAIRHRTMLLVGGGRTVAGLTYVDNVVDVIALALRHPAAAGEAFNADDGLGVTWRAFADDLSAGLGCGRARLSLPYGAASAVATGLEHGYRALRRATGLRTRPLLSRQAVQVLGVDQAFSARKAREVLGWSPRVGYAEGLAATLEWLRDEHLAA